MMPKFPLLSVAIAGALLASACGGSGDSSPFDDASNPGTSDESEDSEPQSTEPDPEPDATEAPVSEPPATDAPDAAETEAEPEPTEEAAPLETVPREPGDGTSADQAAALAAAPIAWSQEGATWSFDMAGLLPVSARNEDNGDCLVLFGTATAVDIADWNWSNPRITPDIDLQVGDELISPNFGNTCDETATLASDHADESNPRLIAGASISFAYHYPLGEFTLGDVDAIVWGGDDEDLVQQYYLPTLIDTPPAAVVSAADYSGFTVAPLAGATVRVANSDTFDLQFQGVLPVPATQFAEENGDGECLVIVGSATAVETSRGFATFGGSAIGLLAGGRLLERASLDCDTSEFVAAGYQTLNGVNLTAGTSIDFFEAVFIPDELADSAQLVVTDAFFSDDPQFFEPTPLDAVPPLLAVPDASVIPPTTGSTADGPFTFQEDADDTTFTISIDGVVNAGTTDDGTLTCFFILGTMTADQEENTHADIGLITSGQYHESAAFDCDGRDVEDAGWESVGFIDFEPGVEVGFNELILVPNVDAGGPQFLVIGDPSAADPHILLDPVYLDAIPTR